MVLEGTDGMAISVEFVPGALCVASTVGTFVSGDFSLVSLDGESTGVCADVVERGEM